jgi:hypothetical protein
MYLPDNDSQILRLSNNFYKVYPISSYREILSKQGRSYNCLLFQTHYNYFICVPYRTDILHDYAYKFQSSIRSQAHQSGLDYSKMVIIQDMDYVESSNAIIDQDEYNETMINLNIIKGEALNYLESYIKHKNGETVLSSQEFRRKYRYSPLQYFHNILGLQ